MKVLFLFESTLPPAYHTDTLSPGELRVINAVPDIEEIIAIGRSGQPFYDLNSRTKQEPGIRLVHVPGTGNIFAYYVAPMWLFFTGLWICLTNRITIIHAESPHLSGIAAVLLSKIFNIPSVIEIRVSYKQVFRDRLKFIPLKFKQLLFKKVTDMVYENGHFLLGNSSYYQQELISRGYRNVDWYNPGVQVPSSFRSISTSKIIIGFLGRLYPDKGAFYALQAYKLLLKKHPEYTRTTRLQFAGNGPEVSRLEDFIIKHRLSDNVQLLGTQNRWEFLSRIHILVNPCIVLPALEMSIAEAGSVGIPTVCFGNANVPVTVIDQQTGIKVQNKQISQLADALYLMIHDEHLRRRLGKGAKKLSRQHFSFASQVRRISSVYSKLLGS